MNWRPRSVRARLTLWYSATLAVVMLVYAAGVWAWTWEEGLEPIDESLRSDVARVEEFVEFDAAGRPTRRADEDAEDVRELTLLPWFEVRDVDGRLVFQSPGSPKSPLATAEDVAASPNVGPTSLRLAGGERVRVLRSAFTRDGRRAVVEVARSERELRDDLAAFGSVLLLGVPLALLLAGGGGFLLARRALSPVDRLVERARTVTAEKLAERLPVENPQDELGRLAPTFNATFARLESSFDQLRRFTADASHELRTPLTALRSVGEVALQHDRSPAEYRETIGSMLEECDRLARLVDDLLALARSDASSSPLRRETIDLSQLAREVADHLSVLAEERRQPLAVDAPTPVELAADRTLLRVALQNLLDNAIEHTPPGTPIRVTVRRVDGAALLEVADRGPGVAPEHRERVFDRFFRVDPSRTRARGGVGLGLSIVRAAVVAHGGTVDVVESAGGGATFRVRLPTTP